MGRVGQSKPKPKSTPNPTMLKIRDGNASGLDGDPPRSAPIRGRFYSWFVRFRVGMRFYILTQVGFGQVRVALDPLCPLIYMF